MSPNERRKVRFLKVITLIGIPIALMFALIYARMKTWDGCLFGLAIAAILVCGRMGIRRGWYRLTYCAGTGAITLAFLYILAIGTGEPYNASWFYILPLVFYTFLDLVWATLFLAVTTLGVGVLLLRPDILGTHVYDGQMVLRFFIIYGLISLVAWAYESTRKGYEAELARQNEENAKQKDFLATLMETLPNPFFLKGVDGRYLKCNKALEEMMNLTRDEIIGKTAFDIVPADMAKIYEQKDRELLSASGKQVYEGRFTPSGKEERAVIFHKSIVADSHGGVQGILGVVFDITELRKAEAEKTALIRELETALSEIKALSGMLPICSSCKKIRDDQGYWQRLETYIENHSQALFSHSICPSCSKKLYGDEPWFSKLSET